MSITENSLLTLNSRKFIVDFTFGALDGSLTNIKSANEICPDDDKPQSPAVFDLLVKRTPFRKSFFTSSTNCEIILENGPEIFKKHGTF